MKSKTMMNGRVKAGHRAVWAVMCLGFAALFLTGCESGGNRDTGQDSPANTKPNIVIIFLDDAGYGDFEPFFDTRYPTPNIQSLAEEGRKFINFYVPQAICSASRAALLTGTYPERNGVFGAHAPTERGLETNFATMAEVLGENGYKTGIFGKWHLGDQDETRPHNRGFDEAVGIMYSNDMWADHPENPEFWGNTRFNTGEMVRWK